MIFPSLKKSVDKIKEHPQLIYTFGIAFAILFAFIFVVYQFSSLAVDAQKRLVNVRAGATEDALYEFTLANLEATSTLRNTFLSVTENNPTVQDFYVVKLVEGKPVVWSGIYKDDFITPEVSQLFSFTAADPSVSFTSEVDGGNGNSYTTVRSLRSEDNLLGYIVMKQSLSEADRVVSQNINTSIIAFSVIMALIMLLFLRHSKIVDYVSLYKRLKEVDELKDDFIGMASHELRAPLTAIRGYAEFVREAPELLPVTKGYAERIDVSAKQLDGLVGDMLDVSRIEQGRMKFDFKEIDPHKAISNVVEMFKIPAQEKKLSITSEILTERKIKVDEGRLQQVLINLVSNAVKYSLKGNILVKAYEEKGKYNIRVIDTGVGMNEGDRRNIFGKFVRIYNEETKDVKGTGLGLWITKQIVEAMSGQISVESIKGVGSHFIISFDIA